MFLSNHVRVFSFRSILMDLLKFLSFSQSTPSQRITRYNRQFKEVGRFWGGATVFLLRRDNFRQMRPVGISWAREHDFL